MKKNSDFIVKEFSFEWKRNFGFEWKKKLMKKRVNNEVYSPGLWSLCWYWACDENCGLVPFPHRFQSFRHFLLYCILPLSIRPHHSHFLSPLKIHFLDPLSTPLLFFGHQFRSVPFPLHWREERRGKSSLLSSPLIGNFSHVCFLFCSLFKKKTLNIFTLSFLTKRSTHLWNSRKFEWIANSVKCPVSLLMLRISEEKIFNS